MNIKLLGETIKILPNSLHNFLLNLSYNNLAGNTENLINLGESMKYLPKNLQNF